LHSCECWFTGVLVCVLAGYQSLLYGPPHPHVVPPYPAPTGAFSQPLPVDSTTNDGRYQWPASPQPHRYVPLCSTCRRRNGPVIIIIIIIIIFQVAGCSAPVGRPVSVWRSGNGVGRINEVTLRRARLVLGWVNVFGQAYHLGV